MSRILDLTGPSAAYAGRLLVEAGHEVIRIDHPDGDSVRGMGPHLDRNNAAESGVYHLFWNAGKKSVALDLGNAGDIARFDVLAASADALLASTSSPIEEQEIAAAHPTLVQIVFEEAESELCAYARSGLLSITGHPGRTPTILGGHIPNVVPALYVALATSAALMVRKLTGAGQIVRLSEQDCLETMMDQAMVDYTALGRHNERLGDRGAATALAGTFPSADGYWVLSVPHLPSGWWNFMEWVKDPELMKDTALEEESERAARKEYVLERLSDWSLQTNRDELVAQAQEHHIPASPVVTALDLTEDEQLKARGFLTRANHPTLGNLLNPKGAIATPTDRDMAPAPLIGAHNQELLN